MPNRHKIIKTPVGELTLVASDKGLTAILWQDDKVGRVKIARGVVANDDSLLLAAQQELNEYFAGTRETFDLPLDFQGTTFQKAVWAALLTIPYGETRSYSAIAKQLGNINAVRAVGAANGKNPISIIAPCHRVIGASGALTGFAGGLGNKRFLLALEATTNSETLA